MKLNSQLIRALRLTLAVASGSLFAHLINLPMSGWVFITTSVVLFDQDTVGGTINRSFMRFFATFIGASISLLCIIFIKDKSWLIWSVVLLSSFIFAYYFIGKKHSYIGLLTSLTLAIVLIGTKAPDFHIAIYRTADIIIGIIFALLAMLLFFPEYAMKRLPQLITSLIQDSMNLIKNIETLNDINLIRQQIIIIEDNFISNVGKFNKALEESSHELSGRRQAKLIESYRLASIQVRRIYRLIFVVFYYEFENEIINNPQVKLAFQSILAIMEQLKIDAGKTIIKENFIELNKLIHNINIEALVKTMQHISSELEILQDLLIKSQEISKLKNET